MLTFADMGGRGGQGKSDMLTSGWGRGDNWIGDTHLYGCFLLNQNIPVLKSLIDSWGVGAWGLWQYKSVQFNLIVYLVKYPAVWEGNTQKMKSLTWGGRGNPKDDIH